jgi:hypothetical protein
MTYAALILLSAICSGLHGWGRIGKGICIGAHVIGTAALSLLALPWFLAPVIAAASGGLLWGTMRRSWHAKAELDYMARKPFSNPFDVMDSYGLQTLIAGVLLAGVGYWQGHIWPTVLAGPVAISCLLPVASLLVFNYDTRIGNKLTNNGRFLDCRRPTELAGGAVAGICTGVVLYVTLTLWGLYAA